MEDGERHVGDRRVVSACRSFSRSRSKPDGTTRRTSGPSIDDLLNTGRLSVIRSSDLRTRITEYYRLGDSLQELESMPRR